MIGWLQNKAHLTPEGLDYIRKIKIGMNKRREFSDPNESGDFKHDIWHCGNCYI